jgi:hypothetical protein
MYMYHMSVLYACVFSHTYAYIHIHTYYFVVHIRTYAYIHIYKCIYTYNICTQTHVYVLDMSRYVRVCIYIFKHMSVCMFVCDEDVDVFRYVRVYTHSCRYVCM